MEKEKQIQVFDWHRIFYAEDIPVQYLGEVAFRSTVMFLILIVALKFLSKRGVKQLSVFELAILIALGSAIGDPMFYNYIPITYGIVVLIVVIVLYKIITGFTAKSKLIERLLEGKPVCLLQHGKIIHENYKKIGLPYDKFFAELRLKSISHLGQVEKVYLETSGEVSVYLLEDKDVIPGLPIYPESIENPLEIIEKKGNHACIYCGNIQEIKDAKDECKVCNKNKWAVPLDTLRVR